MSQKNHGTDKPTMGSYFTQAQPPIPPYRSIIYARAIMGIAGVTIHNTLGVTQWHFSTSR